MFKIIQNMLSDYKNWIKLEINIQREPREFMNIWKLTLLNNQWVKEKTKIRKYVGINEN